MKLVNRNILSFQENDFFFPIRDKIDYAKLIIYSARLLILNLPNDIQSDCKLKLLIDKMSRIFYYKKDKFFSVSFPFTVIIDGDEILDITTYSGIIVDSKLLSSARAILLNSDFRLNPSPMNFWVESDSSEVDALCFLEEIFQFEPAYVRYDKDEANENGKLHPLHHLDINYSSYSTYKLGLDLEIIEANFESILNITSNCLFLRE
ncbi:hypothetical protein EZ456_13560 [Pedobacter psychrodurus]|uniref:Uncharacterized protein n=1 Tax=Pedobacter psychrodurus TaxID=2530456 RepID=A0A4R0PUT4_9SPHI|nr:hypothetical protein [Pedobacter psychrodurus]TCD26321.1 hypothetical protein EZ456_13560 [Pedobacter psychrodurus]